MIRLFSILLILGVCIMGCGRKSPPTLKPYEPPPVVANFNAIRFEDSVVLTWNYPQRDRERLEGFIIQKSHSQNVLNIKVSPESTQFIDTEIKDKETYGYLIYGINKRGVVGMPSDVVTVKVCPIPKDKIVTRHKVHDNYIEILWDKPHIDNNAPDCNLKLSYNIYKSSSADKISQIPINKTPITDTSFKLDIDKEDISYYHIRPLLEGKILHIGYHSYPVTLSLYDLIPSKPKILNYISVENRVFITWKEATESWVTGYKVYKVSRDGNFNEIALVTTPVFTEITEEKEQSYKITAVGPKKEGLPSEIITIKVK